MAVRLIDARLQTATSSGDVYSTISVHRFEDLIVPASKCGLEAAPRRRGDASPSHEVVTPLFFDSGPILMKTGRRDAPRCFWLLLPLQASL